MDQPYVTTLQHAEAFRYSALRARETHPFGSALTVHDVDQYRRMYLYLAPTGDAGAAVTADLDLVSVHKRPGSQSSISSLLQEACDRAHTLDCFDIDGFLPKLYRYYGFVETSRVTFDDDLAPPDWDHDRFGRPDVVLMARMDRIRLNELMISPAPIVHSWELAERIRDHVMIRSAA